MKCNKFCAYNNFRLIVLISLVILGLPLFSIAQIPDGYYNSAQNLNGENLKAALHNIIKGHTEFPYSSSSTDVWDILKDADRDPNNSANVIGIYSNFSMDAAKEYDNNAGWNREHVWAKSRGDFGTSPGAGTDVHHLRAADISTNSARNNRNFDEAPNQYIDGSGNYSGPTDSYTSSTDWVWEPRDEVKGDVARMMFYMATRYEGDSGEPDLELTESLLNNTDKSPIHGKMSVLLAWHLADPVSAAEQNRNDIVYGYQGNRNPYIDHPEYVCEIYTCSATGNISPAFTSSPITTGTEGMSYSYAITATDSDQDAITISGTTIPSWLTFTSQGSGTATLSGTPATNDVGTHSVVLSATDGMDDTSQSFSIVVSEAAGGNNAPIFTSSPVSSVIELQTYTYNITTSDSDADMVTITASTAPTWLSFTDNNNGTALLTGTPANSDIGTHQVILTVDDGTESTTQSYHINVSAADGSSNASELFFSEYIEGSSFNKGLEIANFTGISIDLSVYSIQKQTNGAGDWSSELALTGTLAQGEVFIVVNTSADQLMLNEADIITGGGALTFNGNDPVGLFKNGVLIDILGTFNDTNNFAQNTTLTRKSNIGSPSTTYSIAEWDTHTSNTFTFLGSHIFDSSTSNEVCDIPTLLAADNITSTSADLNWSVVNEANSYNLRYKISSHTVWTDETSNSNSFALIELDGGTEYEFQVKSVCAVETSNYSTSSKLTTLVEGCGSATALSVSEITTNSAILNWTGVSESIDYNIRYKLESSSTWIEATSTATSLSLSGLDTDAAYEFQVQTVCSLGLGSYSTSINFMTIGQSCDLAQNLNATNITSDVAELSWQGSTGATGYSIRYKKSSTTAWINESVTAPQTSTVSLVLSDLSANSEYEFQVQTICENMTSQFSASVNFTTEQLITDLAYNQWKEHDFVKIYPNPSNDEISVNLVLTTKSELKMALYDINGRLVLNRNIQTLTLEIEERLNISELKKGVYSLKISTNTGLNYTNKIVVN